MICRFKAGRPARPGGGTGLAAGGSCGVPAPWYAVDLQWFAAEDEGRTEEPTDITYRKAREEGRVAKSQELIGALVLLFPALAIFFLAPSMLKTCVEMLRFFFLRAAELDPMDSRILAGAFFRYLARLVLPIAAAAVTAALFANLVQTGFLFSTKPLGPDFSRILPRFGRYFQRTLFSMEGLFNFGRSILKVIIIGLVAFFIIRSRLRELANLQTAGLWSGVSLVALLAARILLISALLLLVLSIPDYMFQRWVFRESLKMTRESAKEELKQVEGDPAIRAKLRARYRELLSRDMLKNVPNADVVVTNPTHYAVALEFDPVNMNAPRVTAKGEDELALRIRRIAEENGVLLREIPPLARALYRDTEVGEEIRPYYWSVMITVLGNVWNIEKKRRKLRQTWA
jgi:flagellar biosynthetic protein FlhB